MEILDYMKDLKNYLEQKSINSNIGIYIFRGKNEETAFGSPGGAYDKVQYPAYSIEVNLNQKYLLRFTQYGIAIEAFHSQSQVINFTFENNKTFFRDNDSIVIKENYIMTIGRGRVKVEKVRLALKDIGFSDQGIITEFKISQFNPESEIVKLVEWALIREKAKEIIKSQNQAGASAFDDIVENELGGNGHLFQNIIYYGPPGTGKTYRLQEKMEKYTTKIQKQMKETFIESNLAPLPWWKVIAIILLDLKKARASEIYEHKFLKPKIQASKSNENDKFINTWLSYYSESGNPQDRKYPTIFQKEENSLWSIKENVFKDEYPELYTLYQDINAFNANQETSVEEKRYRFVTFHQSYSYEEFIEGLKPISPSDDEYEGNEKILQYKIKPGIFKELCIEASKNPNEKYVIFIDEINRGNIANIFGELITLIEEDKRGKLKLTLPYSKDSFSVPPNVDVIGSMNTADRSVEAMDIALRRRFSFIEISPDENLVEQPEFIPLTELDIKKIFQTINQRIEKLLDKDHCIGHSYFMKLGNSQEEFLDKLRQSFKNKIIPLLQEYFYGNPSKIGLVLGSEFIKEKPNTIEFKKGFDDELAIEFKDKKIFQITNSNNWTLAKFKSIYES